MGSHAINGGGGVNFSVAIPFEPLDVPCLAPDIL